MIIATKAAAAHAGETPYLWVSVGNNGGLATSTSTTASSWTSQTSGFGTSDIAWVSSNGQGFFVAVGASGKLGTSPNGTTWTQRTSSFGTSDINTVAFGNGYWVAAGNDGKLATSTDGVTWTQRTTGLTGSISASFGNGLWVAMDGANIRTATDPTGAWTSRTSALAVPSYPYYSSLGSIWVSGYALSTLTSVQSSTDGTTWTGRNLPNTTGSLIGFTRFISNSSIIVCWWYTSGNVMDIATSTNGTTWTDRTPAATALAGGRPGVDDTGFMVIPGVANNLQTSSNGTTWTGRTGPTFTQTGICHSKVA